MHRLVGAAYEPAEHPQVSAQFSVRYSLACALVRGGVGIADIRGGAPLDAELRAWADRVQVVVDEDNKNNYCPATVRLTLRDGTMLSSTATVLRGSVDAPLTEEQLIDKLRACLDAGGYCADARRASSIYEALMRVDGAPDVAVWMSDLTKLVLSRAS